MSKVNWDIRFNDSRGIALDAKTDRVKKYRLAMDADDEPDDDDDEGYWITIRGAHVKINGDGVIVAGADGKFNGQKIGDYSKNARAERRADNVKTVKPFLDVADHIQVKNRTESEWLKQMGLGDNTKKEDLKEIKKLLDNYGSKYTRYQVLSYIDTHPQKNVKEFIRTYEKHLEYELDTPFYLTKKGEESNHLPLAGGRSTKLTIA